MDSTQTPAPQKRPGRRARPNQRFVDYRHLEADGTVDSRTALKRLIDDEGFPPGYRFGKRKLRWDIGEVADWIASRRIVAE